MHPIIIPTWKRVDNQRTWNLLHADLHKDVIFVVRPEEADVMRVKYAPSQVDVLPESVKDLAATRQYIWNKYSVLHDRFYQLDDDVLGFFAMTFDGKWQSTRLLSLDEQMSLFDAMQRELDDPTVGVASPRPNWTIADAGKNRYPRHSAAFCTGFYAFDAAKLRPLNLRFDRWVSAGDADFIYQILASGLNSIYDTRWKYDIDLMQPVSEVHKDEAREYKEFMEAWPGYVKQRPRERHHYSHAEEGRGSLILYRTKLWKDALNGTLLQKLEAGYQALATAPEIEAVDQPVVQIIEKPAKPAKVPKVKAVKEPKPPKPPREPSGPGGGWQIKAEWYGKGMTIRCKEPLDGSFWECDHDALADVVNASLKSKGKTILGEPGPSLKQYGSSHGLREPALWKRVNQ